MTDAELILRKIADVANTVGFHSGEPGIEIAGHILSSLVTNPENIERFLVEGTELLHDRTINFENGSLTYRAMNGEIIFPGERRKGKGQVQ
ncbi:hypothetical protein [Pararhizobium sp. LjRoot238]|uniref:hypothetical protein n=1 Tax=Pararhizobium sp. LjRoot238 TaxID=3342293 RepID=UPI003ECC2341